MEWLDQYEMKARIAPTIIVILPLAVAILSIALVISDQIVQVILSSGIALIIVIYILSSLVRYCGTKIEADLWKNWGGPPSTRFMRWSDSTFGDDLKQQLYAAVESRCRIRLSSVEEEKEDPNKADGLIGQAFLQVKATVRHDDPEGIWTKHNVEYGSYRNLLGSRGIWLVFSILGTIACGAFWYLNKDYILIFGLALNVLLAACSILSGWYVLPSLAKRAAEQYAEGIWNSFLVSSNEILK